MSKALKAMDVLESGFEDGIAVLEFPERYRKRLRTTNGLERLNEEIRRRERVIRIFLNRESAIHLAYRTRRKMNIRQKILRYS